MDDNYYFYGSIGTYDIVVFDSTYNDFKIEDIIVEQLPGSEPCGVLPHTMHLKIIVIKPSGTSKRTSQGNYFIQEKYAEGSC
jgi:hypothetical protein